MLLVAIFTGMIASTMYTWITSFDPYSTYTTLPSSVRTILTNKMCSCTVLQIIPVALNITVSLLSGGVAYLIPTLAIYLSFSFSSLSVTIWLTDLAPSVFVYYAKVRLIYIQGLGIALIVLIALAFINLYYAVQSVLLFLSQWLFIRESYVKWKDLDHPIF